MLEPIRAVDELYANHLHYLLANYSFHWKRKKKKALKFSRLENRNYSGLSPPSNDKHRRPHSCCCCLFWPFFAYAQKRLVTSQPKATKLFTTDIGVLLERRQLTTRPARVGSNTSYHTSFVPNPWGFFLSIICSKPLKINQHFSRPTPQCTLI